MMRTLWPNLLFLALGGCGTNADFVLDLQVLTLPNQDPLGNGNVGTLILTPPGGESEYFSLAGGKELEKLGAYDEGTTIGLLAASSSPPSGWEPSETSGYGQLVLPFGLGNEGEEQSIQLLVPEYENLGALDALAKRDAVMFAGGAIGSNGSVYLFGGASPSDLATGGVAASKQIKKLPTIHSTSRAFETLDTTLKGPALAGVNAINIMTQGEELILVTGGRPDYNLFADSTTSAGLFDPTTDSWVEGFSAKMKTGRSEHEAVQLADGRVLLFGGFRDGLVQEWDVFDPESRTFIKGDTSTTGLGFNGMRGAPLQEGGALVCGGSEPETPLGDDWEIYDVCERIGRDGTSVPDTRLPAPRAAHAMATLDDGRILLTGGIELAVADNESVPATSTAWIYESGDWRALPDMKETRAHHRIVAVPGGGAIIVGGTADGGIIYPPTTDPVLCPERFDPNSNTFAKLPSCGASGAGADPVLAVRDGHGAFVLEGYTAQYDGGVATGFVGFGPAN